VEYMAMMKVSLLSQELRVMNNSNLAWIFTNAPANPVPFTSSAADRRMDAKLIL
jgi:hypothetical protein